MPYKFKIAAKFFRSRKRGTALFTALAAILGIAVGVSGLIMAASLARGFELAIMSKFQNGIPSLIVQEASDSKISNYDFVSQKISKIPNVNKVISEFSTNAAISGVENMSFVRISAIGEDMPLTISKDVAEVTGLGIGDFATFTIIGSDRKPIVNEFAVAAITNEPLTGGVPVVKVSKEVLFKLVSRQRNYAVTFGVEIEEGSNATSVKKDLEASLGGSFRVISREELNKPLFTAIEFERRIIFFIIAIIIFIAGLNVAAFVSLLVNERRRDIALLRICGARGGLISAIFFIEGFGFGALGVAIGVTMGIIGCELGNYFKIVSLPSDIYLVKSVSFSPDVTQISLIVVFALALCAGSAWYPSRKARKIKPADFLRI